MRQYRSYNEVPENEKKMLQRADALMNDTPLHVREGVQLWGEFVEDTLDWFVDLWRHGRDDLEKVEAGETNHEFTFTAESRDGTRWESMPVDCHKFRAGDVVGRFVDGSGLVVVVTKRGKDGN